MQLGQTTLEEHKKLNNIKGTAPSKKDPQYEAWDDEDSLVMTWSCHLHVFSNAEKIWENLHYTYYYMLIKDVSACYVLENKIIKTKQRKSFSD